MQDTLSEGSEFQFVIVSGKKNNLWNRRLLAHGTISCLEFACHCYSSGELCGTVVHLDNQSAHSLSYIARWLSFT